MDINVLFLEFKIRRTAGWSKFLLFILIVSKVSAFQSHQLQQQRVGTLSRTILGGRLQNDRASVVSTRSSVRLRSSSIRAEFTAPNGYFGNGKNSAYPSPQLIKFASSPFWMDSFQEENDEDGEYMNAEEDISYLPVNIYELPPKAYNMLQQVTKLYVESDIVKQKNQELDYVKLSSVLEMIDQEYKYTTTPFMIGDETISLDLSKKDRNNQDSDKQIRGRQIVSKVLSFAALNRLPEEIALYLFGEVLFSSEIEGLDTETTLEIQRIITSFRANGGWSSVTFTHGLSLRKKRNYVLSRRDRYIPWPRKSLFTRSQDVADAEEAINEIQQFVKPPPKLIRNQIVSMEEIDQIANELNIQSELSQRRSMKDTMLTFFPNRRTNSLLLNRLLRATSKQRARIFAAGRGGFIASLALTFVWYTCSMIWQWNRLQSMEGQSMYLLRGKLDAVQRSLQKLSRVFISTHFNPRPTKLHRLTLALILSPIGNQALELTQKKLEISADKAVGVISSLLVVLTLTLWTLIILGDATFSRSIVGTFAM